MRVLHIYYIGSPLAGFFANGEIGPAGISGVSPAARGALRTELHGFTSVYAMLWEAQPPAEEGEGEAAP